MKPTTGRIVHYVDGAGECTAAIVTRANPGERFIELAIFPPGQNIPNAVTASGPDETNRPHTWHWPEKEPE